MRDLGLDKNGGSKYRIDPENPKSTDNIETSNDLFDESTVNLFGEDSDSDDDNLRGVSNVVYRKELVCSFGITFVDLFKVYTLLPLNSWALEQQVLFA